MVNWECVRSTSYVFPSSALTDDQAAAYTAAGFELAVHINTGCYNWNSLSTLTFTYTSQLARFNAAYPSATSPTTNRTHCVVWTDYSTQPQVELNNGIRLDTNYYYYPAAWILDRPGLFTGSAMPMRFAASDGTMVDVYQAVTQLTDESQITYSTHISSLLDKALGPEGYYGAFTANMHTDFVPHAGADAIVGAALLRHVPVISARQLLTWLDGRNGSTFGGLTWANNTLAFTIAPASGADGLQAMLPTTSTAGPLSRIAFNGSAISFTRQTIKGIEYAIFAANAGTYSVSYAGDATLPDTVITASPGPITNSTTAVFSFASTKGDGTFVCSLNSIFSVPCSSPKTYTGQQARNRTSNRT